MLNVSRSGKVAFLLAVLAVGRPGASRVRAAEGVSFASVEAPKNAGWLVPGRWKDETIEGKAVCRLVAGTSYAALKVSGEVPKAGPVVMRVRYYSSGKPFSVAIGSWGAPTITIAARPKGWRTAQVVFGAERVQHFLKDGKVATMIKGGGADGPALAKMELLKPDKKQVLELFRAFVAEGTAAAWAASKKPPFQEVTNKYDPAVPLKPTPQDEARGAIPFLRTYLKFIFPGSTPTPAERALKGSVTLTPGEYEPFQFALKALKDMKDLRAEVAGALPKGLALDVRWVECAPKRIGGSRSKKFRIQPERLWPKAVFPACSAKAQEARAWWAVIKASDGLAPKTYPVKIAIRNGTAPVLTYTLAVHVLPFQLPKRTGKDFFLCASNMVEEEAIVRDLAAHGQNSMTAFNDFRPMNGKTVDFQAWDKYFALLKKYGIDQAFFWYLGNPRSGNGVLEGVGKDNFIKILQGINERVKDGRYPKRFALTIDEAVRSGKAYADLKALAAMMKEQAPLLKCQGTSLDRYRHTVRYKGFIDILACNGSFAKNSVWCRENNVLFTTYGYVCDGVSANHTRLSYGFHPWRYGAAGVNGWAMRWYTGHPFNDLDGNLTDWGIFLPNWTGAPISTPSWEGYREGVDDQRYLALYERLVKEGKASDALLKELRKNGIGKMKVQGEKVVGDSVFGASMKNASDLEIARARVIQEILKALGKK